MRPMLRTLAFHTHTQLEEVSQTLNWCENSKPLPPHHRPLLQDGSLVNNSSLFFFQQKEQTRLIYQIYNS